MAERAQLTERLAVAREHAAQAETDVTFLRRRLHELREDLAAAKRTAGQRADVIELA